MPSRSTAIGALSAW
ncbi:hypothetical protein [Kribbella sp. HUAS MG21]